jgi:hypothetical protein
MFQVFFIRATYPAQLDLIFCINLMFLNKTNFCGVVCRAGTLATADTTVVNLARN